MVESEIGTADDGMLHTLSAGLFLFITRHQGLPVDSVGNHRQNFGEETYPCILSPFCSEAKCAYRVCDLNFAILHVEASEKIVSVDISQAALPQINPNEHR